MTPLVFCLLSIVLIGICVISGGYENKYLFTGSFLGLCGLCFITGIAYSSSYAELQDLKRIRPVYAVADQTKIEVYNEIINFNRSVAELNQWKHTMFAPSVIDVEPIPITVELKLTNEKKEN